MGKILREKTLLQVLVTEEELNSIDAICLELKGLSRSALIREAIRDKFRKVFPAYLKRSLGKESVPEVTLTNEQFCESVGGKVIKENGGVNACQLNGGGATVTIPLSDRKDIENTARQMGLIE